MDDEAIGRSLDYLSAHPVAQYAWLRRRVHNADLSPSSEFRKRFIRFYQLRGVAGKNPDVLFGFLGDLRGRAQLPTFADALREFASRLRDTTNDQKLRAEASFTSKVLAILDPDLPTIDRNLLDYFDLKIRRHKTERIEEAARVYDALYLRMREDLASPWWPQARQRFDELFP